VVCVISATKLALDMFVRDRSTTGREKDLFRSVKVSGHFFVHCSLHTVGFEQSDQLIMLGTRLHSVACRHLLAFWRTDISILAVWKKVLSKNRKTSKMIQSEVWENHGISCKNV